MFFEWCCHRKWWHSDLRSLIDVGEKCWSQVVCHRSICCCMQWYPTQRQATSGCRIRPESCAQFFCPPGNMSVPKKDPVAALYLPSCGLQQKRGNLHTCEKKGAGKWTQNWARDKTFDLKGYQKTPPFLFNHWCHRGSKFAFHCVCVPGHTLPFFKDHPWWTVTARDRQRRSNHRLGHRRTHSRMCLRDQPVDETVAMPALVFSVCKVSRAARSSAKLGATHTLVHWDLSPTWLSVVLHRMMPLPATPMMCILFCCCNKPFSFCGGTAGAWLVICAVTHRRSTPALSAPRKNEALWRKIPLILEKWAKTVNECAIFPHPCTQIQEKFMVFLHFTRKWWIHSEKHTIFPVFLTKTPHMSESRKRFSKHIFGHKKTLKKGGSPRFGPKSSPVNRKVNSRP